MKKFTNIGDNNDSINENKQGLEDSEFSIDRLIDLLTLEIEGSEENVTIDYSIKTNNKFNEGIKDYINQLYSKEKLALLEKAKHNQYFDRGTAWIDEEVEAIRESLKK